MLYWMLYFDMCSVVMLSTIMLSAVMLNVIILNAVASDVSTNIFSPFLSAGGSVVGRTRTRTLDLGMMRQVIYHCASVAGKIKILSFKGFQYKQQLKPRKANYAHTPT